MDSGLQVLDSGLFLVSGTRIQDSRPLLPVMFNTAALLRTVKSRWRIVRSSVQTVSIANSSYSEHIRTWCLIITSGHSVREVCGLYDPYGSTNRIYPLFPWNILPQRTIKHAQYRKKHTGYDTLELDMLSSWSREGTINFTVASNNATIFSRTDGLWVVGTL